MMWNNYSYYLNQRIFFKQLAIDMMAMIISYSINSVVYSNRNMELLSMIYVGQTHGNDYLCGGSTIFQEIVCRQNLNVSGLISLNSESEFLEKACWMTVK